MLNRPKIAYAHLSPGSTSLTQLKARTTPTMRIARFQSSHPTIVESGFTTKRAHRSWLVIFHGLILWFPTWVPDIKTSPKWPNQQEASRTHKPDRNTLGELRIPIKLLDARERD